MAEVEEGGRPHPASYLPPRADTWEAKRDPLLRFPGGDELAAELAEAINYRLKRGERHVHPKRGGCEVCAAEAADTVVRYLERNTRVIHSELLAPDEHRRAKSTMRSIPYLSRGHLRLVGDLAVDPTNPTVDDLLHDLETIRDGVVAVVENDRHRERELSTYRAWREAVSGLASAVVERYQQMDPATIDGAHEASPET